MDDSGTREKFATGAVRDARSLKPRLDLISPFALWELGDWLRLGAIKYGDRNWEQGMPVGRCLESLERHVQQFRLGDTDEPHMVAVLCNAMFIIHTLEMIRRGALPSSLNDLPRYPDLRGHNDAAPET
jgi:hypothetical protein